MSDVIHGPSLLTDYDVHLFREGRHFRLYEKLGAHVLKAQAQAQAQAGETGVLFSVWAPNAKAVSVVGDFNDWNPGAHPLAVRWDSSGIWEGLVPQTKAEVRNQKSECRMQETRYKFHITTHNGMEFDKADPFARFAELPPRTASVIWESRHRWRDREWMEQRTKQRPHRDPVSVYELHPGSWRRGPDNRLLAWRELAEELVPYVQEMGFSHVELMPVMEHPFYGSWGYETLGYFAPTSRYGTPDDLKYLIDKLHRTGIGVILDWVPAHFPDDAHGLARFDGTCLFEHADPRQGRHPDWGSLIFNYSRNEVRSFLISSALYWLDEFHADGLRLDAVASMLYLDYSRKPGEWVPNRNGGNENLDAIELLKELNRAAYREHPGIQTYAEESTAWPGVSRPTDSGGLGFGFKWNMGWMHDTLRYFGRDPVHRRHHQNDLTFSLLYAFSENFVLPLSHDEVVHGKRSLLEKLPGDDWQRFANLRLLLGWLYAHPGKKLLFMGSEWGQRAEWNHDSSLDWHLLEHKPHRGVRQLVRDLNRFYRGEPALHELDCEPDGFAWVDCSDASQSVLAFLRRAGPEPNTKSTKGESGMQSPTLLVVGNFTPVPRHGYRVGVPVAGPWEEVLNSDARDYGGSGLGNLGRVESAPVPMHGYDQSLTLTLPPLAMVILRGSKPQASSHKLKTPDPRRDA